MYLTKVWVVCKQADTMCADS